MIISTDRARQTRGWVSLFSPFCKIVVSNMRTLGFPTVSISRTEETAGPEITFFTLSKTCLVDSIRSCSVLAFTARTKARQDATTRRWLYLHTEVQTPRNRALRLHWRGLSVRTARQSLKIAYVASLNYIKPGSRHLLTDGLHWGERSLQCDCFSFGLGGRGPSQVFPPSGRNRNETRSRTYREWGPNKSIAYCWRWDYWRDITETVLLSKMRWHATFTPGCHEVLLWSLKVGESSFTAG